MCLHVSEKCTLQQCEHGGTLHKEECKCECPKYSIGDRCGMSVVAIAGDSICLFATLNLEF